MRTSMKLIVNSLPKLVKDPYRQSYEGCLTCEYLQLRPDTPPLKSYARALALAAKPAAVTV